MVQSCPPHTAATYGNMEFSTYFYDSKRGERQDGPASTISQPPSSVSDSPLTQHLAEVKFRQFIILKFGNITWKRNPNE